MMSESAGMLLLMLIFCMRATNLVHSKDFFHQAPEQHKLSPGWQEPGLWRPKWIMDRVFDDGSYDRLYIKLKADKTMKLYTSKKRPVLELLRPKREGERKKKLFETGKEKMASFEEQLKAAKKDNSFLVMDGTWTWADAAPLNQAKVKLETREGPNREKLRHDTRCDWGTIDGYAANFREGKIFRYRLTEQGVPVGDYKVGSFSVRVSPHRVMVGKDFSAFQ